MTKLKKGMTITVYQDPVTREKVEGSATLISKQPENVISSGFKAELWNVRFIGSGPGEPIVSRRIYTRVHGRDVSV